MKKRKSDNMSAAEFRAQYVDQEEHGLQARCVKWFRRQYPQLLLVAVPNAAKRSFKLAAMLKAEGMLSGFPDLILCFPSGEYGALFIEMKTVNGTPSPEQIVVHAYLRAAGYLVIMPRTFEEFQSQVNQYLNP
ncbi:VRR-NUC domain-containing protein [Spirosoma sordidisoli]|uniref:VRR-NUC domain-containing protein n=1 Tax=Spirosoma sordidisoli TaxID=2502893 RepID=A0A4Q2UMI4_9BACT|nr:VRR-NUC domain-containing protein [Spirosoma sordidisoli]RYC70833.1 VRR-NUC domain-containing protein [Spirosoma sordidisoli]